jgi:hypothetical protein
MPSSPAPPRRCPTGTRPRNAGSSDTFRTPTSPTRPATTFCFRGVSTFALRADCAAPGSVRLCELHLDAPQGAVLSRLLACAQIFDTAREAVRAAIGQEGHYNSPRHPVVGGMCSSMARLITGIDMAGHFREPAPGSFPAGPPGLEQFRFRGADGPAPARPPAAAPDSAPEQAPASAPAPETGAAPARRARSRQRRDASRP